MRAQPWCHRFWCRICRLRINASFSLVALVALLLVGCDQQNPANLLDDYRWRMGNVLDAPISVVTDIAVPVQYPRRRDITQTIPATTINLLQFLRLSRCELQRLLGERNSNLGRIMSASQELLYQQAFMQLAQTCLEQLQAGATGEDLQRALQSALTRKVDHWQALVWNATFAASEFQTLLGGSAAPLPISSPPPSELLARLGDLQYQVQRHTEADWQQLEAQLQVIGSSQHGAQLLQSQRLLIQHLLPVTQALNRALEQQRFCPQAGRLTPRARTLQNVFYKYYIAGVQPYIAEVHQASADFQAALLPLAAEFAAVAPAGFIDYLQENWSNQQGSLWWLFQQQIQAHTRAWQEALQSCGLMPTG